MQAEIAECSPLSFSSSFFDLVREIGEQNENQY